jgi:HPt (histidine-containing phosphotransfer) domain-containing protein
MIATLSQCLSFVHYFVKLITLMNWGLNGYESPAAEAIIQPEAEVDDELMAIYIDSCTKNRAKLTTALADQEWSEVRAVAHSIKGSAISFGYPALSVRAETVQQAFDEGEMDQLAISAKALLKALDQLLD